MQTNFITGLLRTSAYGITLAKKVNFTSLWFLIIHEILTQIHFKLTPMLPLLGKISKDLGEFPPWKNFLQKGLILVNYIKYQSCLYFGNYCLLCDLENLFKNQIKFVCREDP